MRVLEPRVPRRHDLRGRGARNSGHMPYGGELRGGGGNHRLVPARPDKDDFMDQAMPFPIPVVVQHRGVPQHKLADRKRVYKVATHDVSAGRLAAENPDRHVREVVVVNWESDTVLFCQPGRWRREEKRRKTFRRVRRDGQKDGGHIPGAGYRERDRSGGGV